MLDQPFSGQSSEVVVIMIWISNYLDVIFLRVERGAGMAIYIDNLELRRFLQEHHIGTCVIFSCFVFLGVKELNILNRLIIGGFEPL